MEGSKIYFYRPACVIGARGSDARNFLQGQFSNDLACCTEGDCVYGLWLDRKGKALADSFALCRSEESFLLVSCFSEEELVKERLESYLIMDEVELEGAAAGYAGVFVQGSAISVALEELGLPRPESGRWVEADGVVAFWGRRGREAALEILIEKDEAEAGLLDRLKGRLLAEGSLEMSEEEVVELAIEAKLPRIGLEFGPGDLPQELGLVDAGVSFTKGCYLGQEVMARLKSMGRVRRELRRIRISGARDRLRLPRDLVDEGGKKRGELRVVAYSDGGGVGLALVSTGCEVTKFVLDDCEALVEDSPGG